jgi:hypothetical protein
VDMKNGGEQNLQILISQFFNFPTHFKAAKHKNRLLSRAIKEGVGAGIYLLVGFVANISNTRV